MVLGDVVSTLQTICMDFCFKVYNFVSVYLKSIKCGQMATLKVTFHVVVSIYRLVKIWNSPQFPALFRNGQLNNSRLSFVHRPVTWENQYTIQDGVDVRRKLQKVTLEYHRNPKILSCVLLMILSCVLLMILSCVLLMILSCVLLIYT